jgi:hypothetical protein
MILPELIFIRFRGPQALEMQVRGLNGAYMSEPMEAYRHCTA